MTDYGAVLADNARRVMGAKAVDQYVLVSTGALSVVLEPDDARWLAREIQRAADAADVRGRDDG